VILSGEESGIVSRVGVFMKSLKTGPCDLRNQASLELIKLSGDLGEASESSLRIKGEFHDSESARDCFLGDGVSQEDDEDEESIDSLEVLVSLR
jgi:hypothetical protein